ncbi:MAG TPA: biotin--[acetyl-CoA-carboxylase] ligase [Puia sp.]|jgi:BirA family biotin operon repressor/biotin-[acetyl-CoA-carboxylase] ligase|nr:biotin--[acetyl-CoA-carboxylase] ligase [Puia sp.]
MKGGDTSIHSNTKFAMPKNSNLLPHPGKEKPHMTTFDNQLIELESVDSTNNYAMARIHEGMASDGLICLAHHQWAGKGQRGKTWLDEPGQNLIMSLVIEPGNLILSQQFLFSAAVALGVLDLIQTIERENWRIKWPNDIYWNDRKAAGILIESIIKGKNWQFAVVGIGMNLNQESFPEEISNAISLKQITGSNYEPVSFARKLVHSIQNHISLLRMDPSKILIEFNQSLYKRNDSVVLKRGNELIVTKIIGVNENGQLLTDMGSFMNGEVDLKLNAES